MKILYFDCFSGISGDMVIGALIDAGGDTDHLEKELKKLNIKNEYELKFDKVIKNGITGTKFDVLLTHDSHEKGHEHQHNHNHDHDHRSYKDIVKLIKAAEFPDGVQSTAINIFKRIGIAEGKIHGVPLDEVHFHEVGAVDSIIDIVGTAILLDQLKIKVIKSSPIPVGSGNDFARTVYKSYDFDDILQGLISGKEKIIDIGKVNDRFFLNVSSVGIDAEVAKNAIKFKRMPMISGSFAYLLSIFMTLINYASCIMKISVDDKVIHEEILLAAVGNGVFYGGGMKVLPKASITDAVFDLCDCQHNLLNYHFYLSPCDKV